MRIILLIFWIFRLCSEEIPQHNFATMIEVSGPIGPAMHSYFEKSLKKSEEMGAEFCLIEIDTPGGLSTSMREMIQAMLALRIPTVAYVAPKGARAASAGTFLVYAANIAAMAPATNIGASSPVSMGGKETGDTMKKKVFEDSIAYIKSLAELRKRDVTFAIETVKDGKALSAEEALERGVINLIAENREELLQKIDRMQLLNIDLKDIKIIEMRPTLAEKILMKISDPTVAYFLLMLGFYGIIYEIMNFGMIAPGVFGLIAMFLGLYGIHLLPISYLSVLLLVLGIGLMIAEGLVPGFGIFGLGGMISLVIGSFMILREGTLATALLYPFLGAFVVVSALFVFILSRLVRRSRTMTPQHSTKRMIGMKGEVRSVDGEGRATLFLNGEYVTRIVVDDQLKVGDKVVVVEILSAGYKVEKVEER